MFRYAVVNLRKKLCVTSVITHSHRESIKTNNSPEPDGKQRRNYEFSTDFLRNPAMFIFISSQHYKGNGAQSSLNIERKEDYVSRE